MILGTLACYVFLVRWSWFPFDTSSLKVGPANFSTTNKIDMLCGTLQDQRTIWVPNVWKLRIGSFLQILANLAFDSLHDIQVNGVNAKFEINYWNFSNFGSKKEEETNICLNCSFSYIFNFLKYIGQIL